MAAATAAPAGRHRLVLAEGSTPREQGRALGRVAATQICELYALKLAQYESLGAAHLQRWDELADAMTPLMRQHTPHTHEELLGQAEGCGLPLQALLRMAVEYDLSMTDLGARAPPPMGDKCTGLVAHRKGSGSSSGGVALIGQNNDENRFIWKHAELDIIAELRQPAALGSGASADHTDVLLYTHPGIPAYMGVNGAGVSVTWFYVDDGSRPGPGESVGLPTCVLIRELLTFKTALAATAWLKSVPKAVPNAFLIADTEQSFEVECGPTNWAAAAHPWGPAGTGSDEHPELAHAAAATSAAAASGSGGYVGFHANHFTIDESLLGKDTAALGPDATSGPRYECMASSVEVKKEQLGVGAAKEALSRPPVYHDVRTDAAELSLACSYMHLSSSCRCCSSFFVFLCVTIFVRLYRTRSSRWSLSPTPGRCTVASSVMRCRTGSNFRCTRRKPPAWRQRRRQLLMAVPGLLRSCKTRVVITLFNVVI
jgi:hypothetical protein